MGRRLKLLFNELLPYYSRCLHQWCWRGMGWNYRCHVHWKDPQ